MPVYKDECVYTFDNQESPLGVDVCLICFIGTSPDPQHDFTHQHSLATGHTAFLNLQKKLIPIDPEPETETDKSKLAIGAQMEPEYERSSTFKSLAADVEFDFADAIANVLSAESYTKTQELQSWELQLEPCEHVAMLESRLDEIRARAGNYTLRNHCADCELDKSLWLCFECGNLGCGRRQFDGSGGNGHGLHHYEQNPTHTLSVKLGSITPDRHVDVYCYACNDDVSYPQIKELLALWGVDLATQTKTEKSMTELQLEQNMNWDFVSCDGGEMVAPGPGFTGLVNLGNSCYMNSVLQCLFNIPEFRCQFPPNDFLAVTDIGGPENLQTQLRKLSDGLQSGRYANVSPQMFQYLVGKGHPEFATAQQQDAFEYLTYLLTQISEKVNRDLPIELFGFQSERRIACKSCDAVRYIVNNEENVAVAVPIVEHDDNTFEPVTVAQLLDIYTMSEGVESKCPQCGQSEATSTLKFKTFPKNLILNVRRFRIVNWVPQKVDVPVVSIEGIQLDKYLSSGPQPDENVITSDDEVGQVSAFHADEGKLSMLDSMGFSREFGTESLRLAADRGFGDNDFDAAVEILVSGEAQQSLETAPKTAAKIHVTDPESLAMLESMGFTPEQSEAALQRNTTVEAAIDWLFAGNFDTMNEEEEVTLPKRDPNAPIGDATLPANYSLSSTVCHKGASVHVGHYVAAVRRENETYMFNDERITKGSDTSELDKFAYIYIYSRK